MCFILFLVDSLLAAGTSLVEFAVSALSYLMRCERADFHHLLAFLADRQHGACMVEMHIHIVLLVESLVESLTELTYEILVYAFFILRH